MPSANLGNRTNVTNILVWVRLTRLALWIKLANLLASIYPDSIITRRYDQLLDPEEGYRLQSRTFCTCTKNKKINICVFSFLVNLV